MIHGPSKHLSWKELACKDGTSYPMEWRLTRAVLLARAFEAVRTACGDLPIKVLSAYRTPSHNRKIGGAPKSQHLQGRALDLVPPAGMKLNVFYNLILGLVKETDIRGIGLYKTFVHIDIRDVNRLVHWKGYGAKDTVT